MLVAEIRFTAHLLCKPCLPLNDSCSSSSEHLLDASCTNSEVRIEGLETLDYLDNLCQKERFTEQGDALTFEAEVNVPFFDNFHQLLKANNRFMLLFNWLSFTYLSFLFMLVESPVQFLVSQVEALSYF